MKLFSLLILITIITACSTTKQVEEHQLIKPNIVMEISQGLLNPESIFYSPKHEAYFVANLGNGKGYISKHDRKGNLVKEKWLTNLRGPKGITVVGDYLYFTDITKVHKVHIPRARIVKTFSAKETKSLTDTAADDNGNIYVSDANSDILFKIQKEKMNVWIKDKKLEGSSGLFTDGKQHVLAVRKTGEMTMIQIANPTDIYLHSNVKGHLSGIAADKSGMLWISDLMNGDIYSMEKNGTVRKMFNLGAGTADHSIVKELNILIIPQMMQNKIIFVQL